MKKWRLQGSFVFFFPFFYGERRVLHKILIVGQTSKEWTRVRREKWSIWQVKQSEKSRWRCVTDSDVLHGWTFSRWFRICFWNILVLIQSRDVVSGRHGSTFHALMTGFAHPACTLCWFEQQWLKDLNFWQCLPLSQGYTHPHKFKDWELWCHIVFGVGSVNRP